MPSRAECQAAWRCADAVCFDVDSTVIVDEGLDQLAAYCGKGEQIRKMTLQAMGGNMEFREALRMRLNVIRPSLETVQKFIRAHPPVLTKHIGSLVDELHARDIDVYLVSGGYRSLISPVA